MTPVKYSERLAQNLPETKLVAIEKAGHMVVALKQSEAVVYAVYEWIGGL
jgi:hypothetical protein